MKKLLVKHPPKKSSTAPDKTNYKKMVSGFIRKGDEINLINMRFRTIIEPILTSSQRTKTIKYINQIYGISRDAIYNVLDLYKDKGKQGLGIGEKKPGRPNCWEILDWEILRRHKKQGMTFKQIIQQQDVIEEVARIGEKRISISTYLHYI